MRQLPETPVISMNVRLCDSRYRLVLRNRIFAIGSAYADALPAIPVLS